MYPYFIFIHDRSQPALMNERQYYKVAVNSYREYISATAFRRLNMTVPHQVGNTLENWLHAYTVGYNVEYDDPMDMTFTHLRPELPMIEMDLYDFYSHIGYDKQTKKFNGETLNQLIRRTIRERGLV